MCDDFQRFIQKDSNGYIGRFDDWDSLSSHFPSANGSGKTEAHWRQWQGEVYDWPN